MALMHDVLLQVTLGSLQRKFFGPMQVQCLDYGPICYLIQLVENYNSKKNKIKIITYTAEPL